MRPDLETDFLIIGAGFAGLVAAQRLAEAGWRCVVADRRPHLAGNAHDRTDAAGVLIHPYGPHYFRSNSPQVVDHLSRFTAWREVSYVIKSHARGRYWSFPVNLNTFEEFIGRPSSTEDFEAWLAAARMPLDHPPRNSEEVILSQVGRELYELFFEGYTLKQWKRHPRELDASVAGRVPIRVNRDDRYLTESFQALPDAGYTAMFERMVEASPGLRLCLGMDHTEAIARHRHRHLIFTGAVDEYFNYRLGELPYRSLRFEMESFSGAELASRLPIAGKPGFWQPALQVNYPEPEVPHTRIVEIKHATGQRVDATTIVREFPADWTRGGEPFYPVPAEESRAISKAYADLARQQESVSFIGRLATYRYYNMDQVAAMALKEAAALLRRYGPAPH